MIIKIRTPKVPNPLPESIKYSIRSAAKNVNEPKTLVSQSISRKNAFMFNYD